MSSMKSWISQEPVVRVVDPTLLVSEVTRFIQFNLYDVTYEEIDKFTRTFTVKVHQEGIANGLTFWFEAEFTEGAEKV